MADNDKFDEVRFTLRRVSALSSLDFDEVVRRIETLAPRLDPATRPAAGVDVGSIRQDIAARSQDSGFVLLAEIDHGLLERLGRAGRSVQYAIGNPLVAAEITGKTLAGALYAPFRLAVYQAEEDDVATILFDDPSDLMGSLGDDSVAIIGETLSAKIRALVARCL